MSNGSNKSLPGPVRVVFGLLKTACILAGLPLTMICVMAMVGAVVDNIWVRLVAAVVVGLVLPLVLVDRVLPEDRARARGLPTDLLAVFYVAIPLVVAGAAHGFSSGLLAREGDRLVGAGWAEVGKVSYWLARVQTTTSRPTPTPTPTHKPDAGVARSASDAGSPRDATRSRDAIRPDTRRGPVTYTPAELFRKCAPSVVNIKTGRGGGTGFLIDDHGTIATNSHVIHDATDVEVKLRDGTWIREVDLLVESVEADLALLRVKHSKLSPPLTLGDSDASAVGDQVVAIGNPLGLEHTLTDGLVSARRIYRGRKWLQISVPISPGNSGGPLFAMTGEVVGVTTAVFSAWSGAQNLNLAVPINDLKAQIKDAYPDRKSIGTNKPQTW